MSPGRQYALRPIVEALRSAAQAGMFYLAPDGRRMEGGLSVPWPADGPSRAVKLRYILELLSRAQGPHRAYYLEEGAPRRRAHSWPWPEPDGLFDRAAGRAAASQYPHWALRGLEGEAEAEARAEPPPGPPPPPPARTREAFRCLVADVTARFVRREAERARRAAKKGAGPFQEWVEEFYSGEGESLASHLAPCVALALAQRGSEGGAEAHASSIAAEYLSRSKQELLDLKASDLAGLVDSRMKRWEATRPWEVADKIAAIGAAGGVEHEA